MKPLIIAIGVSILFCAVSTSEVCSGQKPSTPSIIKGWYEAKSICKEGSADDREAIAWCSVSEGLLEVLTVRNWCYGKADEASYQNKWHKCTSNSFKQELPY